jgi:hypothetical protein
MVSTYRKVGNNCLVGNFCWANFTIQVSMDYRQQTIADSLYRNNIDISKLKQSGRKCVVCAENTLLIIGEGYDNKTKYVCSNKICNCQYSLA